MRSSASASSAPGTASGALEVRLCALPLVSGRVVPGIGIPVMRACTISSEGGLRLSSPDAGVPRPSGPLDPLLELHATLPLGVPVPMRGGLVKDADDCEHRLRLEKPALGR
jgi:hypothetical protein